MATVARMRFRGRDSVDLVRVTCSTVQYSTVQYSTVQVDLVLVTCTTVASGAAQYSTDMLLDSRPANTLVTVNCFQDRT